MTGAVPSTFPIWQAKVETFYLQKLKKQARAAPPPCSAPRRLASRLPRECRPLPSHRLPSAPPSHLLLQAESLSVAEEV